MSARRDKRTGKHYFRFFITGKGSIYGTPGSVEYPGLSNTKKGAEEAERICRARLAAAVEKPEVETLEVFWEFYDKKMQTVGNKRGANKVSTLTAKRSHMRTHLLPRFGKTRIDQIDDLAFEDLKIDLGEKELKPKTINNIMSTLLNILTNAKLRKKIAVVPDVQWVQVPEQGYDYYNFSEAENLLVAAASSYDWACAVVLAIKTGMRLGELRGLLWDDVDLVAGRVHIRRNLVRTDGRDVEGTPKNGKSRTIDLPASAVKALKAHRHLRGKRVFCDLDGNYQTIGVWRAALYRVCRAAGLREVGWHTLRHTFASHLAMRGEPLKTIGDLMGHSSLQMTNRYAHLAPGVTRTAVAKLDEPAPVWICSGSAADDATN